MLAASLPKLNAKGCCYNHSKRTVAAVKLYPSGLGCTCDFFDYSRPTQDPHIFPCHSSYYTYSLPAQLHYDL